MTRTQLINIILLIIWLGVIFKLSSEPSSISSVRSGSIVHTLQSIDPSLKHVHDITFFVRKAAHITAYFILGILMFRVVRMYTFVTRKTVLLSIVLVALYAASDEFHQMFVNGRSPEVTDVLIDLSAGTLGVLITFFIIRSYAARKRASPSKIAKNKV